MPSIGHIQPLHHKEKQLSLQNRVGDRPQFQPAAGKCAPRGTESSSDRSARGLSFAGALSKSVWGNEEDFYRCFLLPDPSTGVQRGSSPERLEQPLATYKAWVLQGRSDTPCER